MTHENIQFKARVYIDVMYLDERLVLQIIDEGTIFSAARVLSNTPTDAVSEATISCRPDVYNGLTENIILGEGAQFWDRFAGLANSTT